MRFGALQRFAARLSFALRSPEVALRHLVLAVLVKSEVTETHRRGEAQHRKSSRTARAFHLHETRSLPHAAKGRACVQGRLRGDGVATFVYAPPWYSFA